MALYIDANGAQRNIDLHLEEAAQEWGESPVHFSALHLGELLGEHYDVKRLDDGRLIFSSDPSGSPPKGLEVLLTAEESSVVITCDENTNRQLMRIDADRAIVAKMQLEDVVSGGAGYGTSQAMASALNSGRTGIELLIALLFAEKISPLKVLQLTGCSSSAFLATLTRMQQDGIFSDWK
jgi:hypothetical protein